MGIGRPFKISFEDWCIANNRHDILDRWDIDLNDKKPSEISSNGRYKCWLKCENGIHESEQHSICNITTSDNCKAECKQCKSCAQALSNKYGKEYVEKIIDINPDIDLWNYGKSSHKKIQYICPSGKHEYEREICAVVDRQCLYCNHHAPNISPAKGDSLADLHPEYIRLWSDKNKKTPNDYYSQSNKSVFWKCENNLHPDYERSINRQIKNNLGCPECSRMAFSDRIREDLVGQVFGELTVIEIDKSKTYNSRGTYWICRCSCGAMTTVWSAQLKSGKTKTCGNRKIHYSDKNNPNWRGGKTSDYEKARKSDYYSNWRNAVYAKDWYTCQCCGASGSTVEKQAHHILNFSSNEELRYDVSNGITLCKACHYSTEPGSFHNIYGTSNNTPEQLEEFINKRRNTLGINVPFTIDSYKNGNILKPKKIEIDGDLNENIFNL